MIINLKPHQTGLNNKTWTGSNLGWEIGSYIFKIIIGVNCIFNFSFIVYTQAAEYGLSSKPY